MENAAPIYFDKEVDALNIVVQADSSLSSVGGTRPAICVTNVDDVTILSLNDAKLTVKSKGVDGALDYTTIWGSQVAGTIQTDGNLTLQDTFVDVEFFGAEDFIIQTAGIFVYNADLTIDNSVVNIGKGHFTVGVLDTDPGYLSSMTSPLQLVGAGSDLVIQNGSNVTLMNTTAQRPIRYDGAFTISDSNFEAGSTCIAGSRRIFRDTLPTISDNTTIVGSTAAPTIDPANFTMTAPADTAEVDPTTLVSTKYYYIKITVKEAAPELPTVAARTLILDDVNDINFLFLKSDLAGLNIDDLTVYFTMDRQEGYEDRVEEAKLESYDKHGGIYYRVKFNNVAAKEMCDNIKVVVKDSEGNAVTKEYTTTMAKSIWDLYNTYTGEDAEKWQNLCVAMANYGAAAQIAFNYNTTDLASKYFDEC